MGYDTNYELKIEGTECLNPIEEFDLRKVLGELLWHPPKGDITLIYFEGTYYNIKDQLKELAKKYPTLVFDLNGDGENQGDIWRLLIKGDKSCLKRLPPVTIDISLDELK